MSLVLLIGQSESRLPSEAPTRRGGASGAARTRQGRRWAVSEKIRQGHLRDNSCKRGGFNIKYSNNENIH